MYQKFVILQRGLWFSNELSYILLLNHMNVMGYYLKSCSHSLKSNFHNITITYRNL